MKQTQNKHAILYFLINANIPPKNYRCMYSTFWDLTSLSVSYTHHIEADKYSSHERLFYDFDKKKILLKINAEEF